MAKQSTISFGERVKNIRQELGLSQDALGTQGFISTPGWIKIENGQRQASEELIEHLTKWLVQSKHIRANASSALREELLTLKYMGSSSKFVQDLAKAHFDGLPGVQKPVAEPDRVPVAKPAKAKPPAKAVALAKGKKSKK